MRVNFINFHKRNDLQRDTKFSTGLRALSSRFLTTKYVGFPSVSDQGMDESLSGSGGETEWCPGSYNCKYMHVITHL